MKTTRKKLLRSMILFCFTLFSFFSFFAVSVHAQSQFVPLVNLPRLDTSSAEGSIPQLINNIYLLTIVLGALLGVLRIAWAGVKYSLSDVVTDKHAAKHDIQGVLLGLAILLIPTLVLNTINPDLINLDVLKKAPRVTLASRQVQVNTTNMTPMERAAAYNSCTDGTIVTTGTGSICCETATNKCNVQSAPNPMGINTTLKYNAKEINDMVDEFIVNSETQAEYIGRIGAGNLNPQAACTEWGKSLPKGAEPVVFNQIGTATGGTVTDSQVVVCVEKK